MKEKYIMLCREYYDKVGSKIENESMTIKQAKSLFDNFMLNVVVDYFEEENDLIEKEESEEE